MAGFDRTFQDFSKRTQDNNRALMQGDINVGQRLLRSTGDIESLVSTSVNIMGDSKAIAALLMLLVGLF